MSNNIDHVNIPKRYVDENNLSDFGLLAKRIMEESEHIHAGAQDNGLVWIYPCGTEEIFVFPLHVLVEFVNKRNISLANGSQYDALHGIIALIKEIEGQRMQPKQEPEVLRGPAVKRGETFYDAPSIQKDSPHPLVEMLGKQLAELAASRPKVWDAEVHIDIDEGDFASLAFEARDLYDVADRLASFPFVPGAVVSITLNYVGDENGNA